MPFKQQHYVTLLMHLSYRLPSDGADGSPDGDDAQTGEKRKAEDDNEADCGREVLEELGRSFRASVEGREWLNARLLVSHTKLRFWADACSSSSSPCSCLLASWMRGRSSRCTRAS